MDKRGKRSPSEREIKEYDDEMDTDNFEERMQALKRGSDDRAPSEQYYEDDGKRYRELDHKRRGRQESGH